MRETMKDILGAFISWNTMDARWYVDIFRLRAYSSKILFLENIIFDQCVATVTHWSKHIHRRKKLTPFLSLFLVFGGVATLPHLQIVKKYFDECVSTNVLQLGHINRIRWMCFDKCVATGTHSSKFPSLEVFFLIWRCVKGGFAPLTPHA